MLLPYLSMFTMVGLHQYSSILMRSVCYGHLTYTLRATGLPRTYLVATNAGAVSHGNPCWIRQRFARIWGHARADRIPPLGCASLSYDRY